MKKVVTINLGGNAYQIDEDGYDALTGYLETARARLDGNPDVDEIMSDLELAIADKARRFLHANKTVVAGSEVVQIIAEMGPVDAPLDEDAAAERPPGPDSSAADPDAVAAEPDTPFRSGKKLYRLTRDNDKMIAGVCAGLAAYSNLDVSIVRILFLALAIATVGTAVLVYIALAVIVPAAATPEQQAQAHGRPFDAQDVLYRAKSKFSELSGQREAGRQAGAGPLSSQPGGGSDLFRWLLAALVVGLGVFLLLNVLLGFLGPNPVMMSMSRGMYYGFGTPPIVTFAVVVLAIGLVLWVLGGRTHGQSSFLGSVLLGAVQLILILGLIWFAYHAFDFVRHFVDGGVMVVHRVLA